MREQAREAALEWGASGAPHPAHDMSGDVALVVPMAEGALIAAVDGLGHGPAAGQAAEIARQAVLDAASSDIVALVHHLHGALRGSRGAALALAYLSTSAGTLSWLGVGSVEGRLIAVDRRRRTSTRSASLRRRRGVVGHQLPAVGAVTIDIRRGDIMILATDGIRSGFGEALNVSGSPKQIAERILADHWTVADDGLVFVLRYLGSSN